MLTYQDWVAVGEDERARAEFANRLIQEHESSDLYQIAKVADDYNRSLNTTTMNYQKTITDLQGRVWADKTATVHRSTSSFFQRFVMQLTQYLLGNGVTWEEKATDTKLGKTFDTRLQQAAKAAMRGGVSFGFWNYDHLEVFQVYSKEGCFAPLYDEEDGLLKAGIRYWQIDKGKPLRAVFYELEGMTSYLWTKDPSFIPTLEWQYIADNTYFKPREPYTTVVRQSEADGVEIIPGENYPAFPIVPLWANPNRQSEIVGLREKIDAYDFITNGWEDDLDNAQIYWIIKGAGGMDDPDLAQFLDRLRTVKAAAPADGQEVDPVTLNLPVEAREKLLERLDKQLYRDAMILNPDDIASGAATATQIRAAYEPQDCKASDLEYCILEFLDGILEIAGIEDHATFTRSKNTNVQEEVTTVVQAATYLSPEYVTRKILTLLGDGDQADKILQEMDNNASERLSSIEDVTENA